MHATRSLLSLFGKVFAPFVSAWRDEFGPRPAKAAPQPAPVAEPAPVPVAPTYRPDVDPLTMGEPVEAIPLGWSCLAPAEPVAVVPAVKPARKPRAKAAPRAKAMPAANRTTAKGKPKRKPAKK